MTTRTITGIVIHCSGTPNGQWVNAHEIDRAHLARGLKRAENYRQHFNTQLHAIGCHFVIYPNGAIATGRHLDEPGQHTQAHNLKTIAICLAGSDKFTPLQWAALRDNVSLLLRDRPKLHGKVAGCGELPGEDQNSPGFSVAAWLAGGMQPLDGHILQGEAA